MNEHALTRLVFKYRSSFMVLGVFSIFFNILVLTMPIYMLTVFSHVMTSRSQETLTLLTVAAIVALIIQGLLDFIRSRILVRIGLTLDMELTPQVVEAIVRHAAGSAERNSQRLRDAAELRNFLTGTGIFNLFDAPFVPFYVLVIYLMHPMLGHLALFGSLLLFAIAVVNELITRKPVKSALADNHRTQQRVDEFVRNADAIEAMGMMPAVIEQWRMQNNTSLMSLNKGADTASYMQGLAKFVRFLIQVLLYGVGAYLFLQEELMTGAIIASSILMGRALAPVEAAISTWKNMVGAKNAFDRLKEILAPERLEPYRNRMSLPTPEGRLQLERVVVMAPGTDRMTLKGVGFAIEPGDFLGVVGPSGAGKSTLAKLIVGILRPKSGSARLDGVDLASWHPDELGQHVGYLPQDVQLFNGTVRENIARLSRNNDPEAVIDAAKKVGMHETILQLPNGYDTNIGDGGAMLSAGQRQHLGLARALYGNPRLLILDEPNSNLDSVSEEALLKTLEAAKKEGITIVVITHRPSILQSADKMLMLRNGMVEMFGTRAQIMQKITAPSGMQQPANKEQNAPKLMAQGESR
ncbi:MAG: type I secretion system permease/ATPase [Hydrogenophilaceae bacterium]|nr:type I secretion system permease/ATPase [Hydrogenophilaceae bacterium]